LRRILVIIANLRKPVIAILLAMSSLCSLGQVDNNRLLRTFVSDSAFCKYIAPCKQCDTIFIVDTVEYFTQDPALWNKIKVTKKILNRDEMPHNYAGYRVWVCNNFFITKITQNKNIYRISYFHLPTNNVGFVEYHLKKNKLIKVKFQYGQL
jgi:hypothetical protein